MLYFIATHSLETISDDLVSDLQYQLYDFSMADIGMEAVEKFMAVQEDNSKDNVGNNWFL